MLPTWVIFLILLVADVAAGWMISESPVPVLLVPAGIMLFFVFRLGGRALAHWSILVIASAICLAGWWLFYEGRAMVMLSDLPFAFHLGLAIHFWLWGKAVVVSDDPGPGARLVWALVAGALVFWTSGTAEIYGYSKLLVRSLAALGLMLPAWQALAISGARTSHSRSRRFVPLLAAALGSVVLGGMVASMEWFSFRLYDWTRWEPGESELAAYPGDESAATHTTGPSDSSVRDIPRRADIEMDDEVRLFFQVRGDAHFKRLTSRPIYVRTSTLAVFDNDSRLSPRRRGEWVFDSDDGEADGKVVLPAEVSEESFRRPPRLTYSVLIHTNEAMNLPLLTGTDAVQLDSLYEFADNWYQLGTGEKEDRRVRFDATAPFGLLERVEPAKERGIRIGNMESDPYLQLPASALAARVGDLVRREIQASSPGEMLRELEDLLAGRCQYSLKYENEKDLPPVENFLFEERKGHCELYAVSAVMMLRQLGIPSRVGYGYHGGRAFGGERIIAFRNSDFHAWAEIYLEGRGWTVFDTTPADSGRVGPPEAAPNRSSFAMPDLAAYEDIGGAGPMVAGTEGWFSRALESFSIFLVRNFVPLLVLAGVLLLGWIWFAKPGEGSREDAAAGTGNEAAGRAVDLPRFARELMRAGEACGHPKARAQTWLEFLGALKRGGVCNGEFDEMVDYLHDVRYRGRDRDRGEEKRFVSEARTFRRSREEIGR